MKAPDRRFLVGAGLVVVCLALAGAAAVAQGWLPSRYGPKDQIGALNEVSANKVRQARALITRGRRADLGDIPGDPLDPSQGI